MVRAERVGLVPFHRVFYRSPIDGLSGGGGGARAPQRFSKMTLEDLARRAGGLRGKTILVRVDFNVTDPKTGTIKSDMRIRAALPTVNFLSEQGARIVLISHNERPGDVVKKLVAGGMFERQAQETSRLRLSLKPAAERLQELLGREVLFLTSCDPWDPISEEVLPLVETLEEGGVAVLENTRFYKGDESKDPLEREAFAKKILAATNAWHFVQDAFASTHRKHGSTVTIAQLIRERGGLVVAGRLLQKEIEFLGQALLESPKTPYVAFMGGAKVADKIGVIQSLLGKVDRLVIGGAMLYPFLLAMGCRAGDDPLPPEVRTPEALAGEVAIARTLLEEEKQKLVIPRGVIAQGPGGEIKHFYLLNPGDEVPAGFWIRDVDPAHLEPLVIERVICEVGNPQTVVWNGPFGKFEEEQFSGGTVSLLQLFAGFRKRAQEVVIVAGGGDSEKAIKVASQAGVEVKFDHVSTGGGAMLELLEKGSLPGIDVIDDKEGK